jgi:hypothetical protein
MGLIQNCILSGIHILLIGVDILFFFLLMRMLAYRWRPRWLIVINASGEPVALWFMGHIADKLRRLRIDVSSEPALLFIGMLVLGTIRMLTFLFL